MPPPISPEVLAAQQTLREAQAGSSAARGELAAAEGSLRLLGRAGGTRLTLAQRLVDRARVKARDAASRAGVAQAALDELLERHEVTPEMLLAGQSRDRPVALLPLRIETRYHEGKLKIRVYPDQVHVHAHVAAISATEAAGGAAYWEALAADGTQGDAAWERLTTAAGSPERARHVAATTRPGGSAAAPLDALPAVQTQARLLPARWCVTLMSDKGDRMARKWSGPVRRNLMLSPAGDLLEALDEPADGQLALDEEAQWLVSFDEALAAGMAVEIGAGDLAPGFTLATPIRTLVVVGTDWTIDPDAGSAALAEQLAAHAVSDGLGLVAPGTPTNNSAAGAAGFSSDPRVRRGAVRAPDPARLDGGGDLARLGRALGFGEAATGALEGVPGSDLAMERSVRPLHTALWGACFGFYLGHVLDPLMPADRIDDVRAHLRDHVRPAGPLPTIRIGRQPYGILPVLAASVRLGGDGRATEMHGFTGEIATVLTRIRALAEGFGVDGLWNDTLAEIPSLHGNGDGAPAERLAAILKMGPMARTGRVRATLSAAQREAAGTSSSAAERHASIVSLILSNLTSGVRVFPWQAPLMFDAVVPARPRYRLDAIPWVAADLDAGDALARAVTRMRERIALAAASPSGVRGLLTVAAGEADTLLEGLLFLSGAYEYWEAGRFVLADHLVLDAGLAASARVSASALTEIAGIATVGMEAAAKAPAGHAAVETPRQLLQVAGDLTADRHLAGHLLDLVDSGTVHEPVRNARAFGEALGEIAGRPPREIDQALRGLLDLGSHRIDAWITSLATRRLAEQRAAAPSGVHVGAYGIVHDLAPDPTPFDSEGYLHLPSTDHAVAAAVLRSGHVANRAFADDAFAIRLTAERTRNALAIAEGLAAGQPASALVGYRFERWLIEDRLSARFIGPLRKLKPHPGDAPLPGEAAEAIAPRDVVDGLALAETWKEAPDSLRAALAAEGTPADAALERYLDALVDLHDAFLDLWMGEAAFQMVRGSTARTAAALATLDRQERPPEPQSVHTPRAAWGYAQRVMWTLPASARAEGWPEDAVSRAEPAANAMAAGLIGDPERFAITGDVVDAGGAPIAGAAPRTVALADLGLSPLALLRACKPAAKDEPSPLEEIVAARLADQAALPADAGMVLRGGGADGDGGGFAMLLALLASARAALFDRPALIPQTLAPPVGLVAEAVEADALAARAKGLRDWLDDRLAALEEAIAGGSVAAIHAAVLAAGEVAPVAGWVRSRAARDDPAALAGEAAAVRATLANWQARWNGVVPASADPHAMVEADAARMRIVLGNDVPILPPFAPGADLRRELRASLADGDALLGAAGGREIRRWRRAMALVRPQLAALSAALDAARWSGGRPEPLRVAQLPHVEGQRWASLPFDPDDPPRDTTLSIAIAGDIPASGRIAGLLLDEWTESVPERRTATSIVFHVDAPAARPPQAILLAVDPGVEGGGWTVDALVTTVVESFDLARLRLLRPDQIVGSGAVLPTTFLPRNLSEETLSFDLLGTVVAAGQLHAAAAVLGKGPA